MWNFKSGKIQEAQEAKEAHSWMTSPDVHWNCFPASEPLVASLEEFQESETVAFEWENYARLASFRRLSQKKKKSQLSALPLFHGFSYNRWKSLPAGPITTNTLLLSIPVFIQFIKYKNYNF